MQKTKLESAENQKFTLYQIFLIALLAVLQFTVLLGFSIISPLGDIMMKDLDIDTAQFGLLISGYAFGAGFSGLLVASVADRYDRKTFLLFFYAGFLAGLFLCGIARSFPLLLVSRTVTGIFGGVISSISMSIVADTFPLNHRGRVMGYVQMAFTVSQIAGIPLGLLIANRWGWNANFLAITAIGIITGVVIKVKMKPLREHLKYIRESKNAWRHLLHLLTEKKYFAGYALITLTSVGGAMLMPFSAPFLINNVGVTQEQLPFLYMITGIAGVFIMIYTGKISDRFPKKNVFLAGTVVSIIMTVIFTNLTPVALWVVVVVNILLFIGINGRFVPSMALNTAVPKPEDRGGYMSLCSAMQQFSNGVGSLVAGLVIFQPVKSGPLYYFDAVGYIVCVVTVICVFLVYRVARQVSALEEA
ncbi:MAG: MFS transporter [Tannerella sp.]|nr:MFS transporter [Tannerella sp.]